MSEAFLLIEYSLKHYANGPIRYTPLVFVCSLLSPGSFPNQKKSLQSALDGAKQLFSIIKIRLKFDTQYRVHMFHSKMSATKTATKKSAFDVLLRLFLA